MWTNQNTSCIIYKEVLFYIDTVKFVTILYMEETIHILYNIPTIYRRNTFLR